ncbi:nuclear transport factor 2 family protein [Lutispora saccharofermentans]|uniref:Nuclear transport factor 2 family protein n=1 Tax=Lutispora saccharofermentans TaxID=3024236 RepID=A0ABT1NH93_9FIRM|nr:nuclear transport factor 2 family protein [Lutispora saccharofermentans]MCQ1530439.1 nuclear transport factor 2 family protein [Lutispora saccharofermentans]
MFNAEVENVREVIHRYINGTYKADIPVLESVFHKDARMAGYLGDMLLIGTPAPFIEDMASAPSMESMGNPYKAEIRSLSVTGLIANVIVYETGFRGNVSLEDHFHLICDGGEWKIISKTFTTIG